MSRSERLVAGKLSERGLLDEVGGKAFIVELLAETPASSNAVRYAKVVVDKAHRRRRMAASDDLYRALAEGDERDIARAE